MNFRMIRTLAFAAGAALAASAVAAPASATVQTIDFSSGTYQTIFSNNDRYTEDGFLLRPRDDGDHTDCSTSIYCWHNGPGNTAPNPIEISYTLGNFDLISFDLLANGDGLNITSDKGGFMAITAGTTGTINFSGAEWLDVSLVTLEGALLTGNSSFNIDNLVVDDEATETVAMPEPAVPLALGAALLLLGRGARRARRT